MLAVRIVPCVPLCGAAPTAMSVTSYAAMVLMLAVSKVPDIGGELPALWTVTICISVFCSSHIASPILPSQGTGS